MTVDMSGDMPEWERQLRIKAGAPLNPSYENESSEDNVCVAEAATEAATKVTKGARKEPKMVEAAFGFIGLCNQFQTPRTANIISPDGMSGMGGIETPDSPLVALPEAQEVAFNYACKFVQEFFKNGCDEPRPTHPEISDQYTERSCRHDPGSGPQVGPKDVSPEGD